MTRRLSQATAIHTARLRRHKRSSPTLTRKVPPQSVHPSEPDLKPRGTRAPSHGFRVLEGVRNLIKMGFGPHLVLDGYGGSYESLTDLSLIYRFLDECPERIRMTKIMPPYVFKYSGANPKDWGVSGFVLIAESHISIHTFPEKGYLSIDVFSCQDFDPKAVIAFAEELFGLSHYEHQLFDRGSEFPHDMIRSARIVETERLHLSVPASVASLPQ